MYLLLKLDIIENWICEYLTRWLLRLSLTITRNGTCNDVYILILYYIAVNHLFWYRDITENKKIISREVQNLNRCIVYGSYQKLIISIRYD